MSKGNGKMKPPDEGHPTCPAACYACKHPKEIMCTREEGFKPAMNPFLRKALLNAQRRSRDAEIARPQYSQASPDKQAALLAKADRHVEDEYYEKGLHPDQLRWPGLRRRQRKWQRAKIRLLLSISRNKAVVKYSTNYFQASTPEKMAMIARVEAKVEKRYRSMGKHPDQVLKRELDSIAAAGQSGQPTWSGGPKQPALETDLPWGRDEGMGWPWNLGEVRAVRDGIAAGQSQPPASDTTRNMAWYTAWNTTRKPDWDKAWDMDWNTAWDADWDTAWEMVWDTSLDTAWDPDEGRAVRDGIVESLSYNL